MKLGALFRENLKIAFVSIRTNLLRTILTILIIAFGIMALVGIQTSIKSIETTIRSSFSAIGANSFYIRSLTETLQLQNEHKRQRGHQHISFSQADAFKQNYTTPSVVGVSTVFTYNTTVKYLSEQTNPNIRLMGGDENYLQIKGLEVESGRNFSRSEIEYGTSSVIIGADVAKVLFKDPRNPVVGETVNVAGAKYTIIGVLKRQGSGFGGGSDNWVIIPIINGRAMFPRANQDFRIDILPSDSVDKMYAMSEAEGLFRIIRRVYVSDPSDFDVRASDGAAREMDSMVGYATIAALIIGLITMLGAAVGLMNIMLVSVTERTREIGTRKAIGAKASTIKQQFLFESILIGQLGGACGILFGLMAGNLIALAMGGAFVVPWDWVFAGVTICFLVSIASGYIPAVRAARLDPIESLRSE